MRKIKVTLSFCLIITSIIGQQKPVDIADLTIKINAMGSKDLFYGFAEGDEIIFNFEELKGKTLKEVKIIELPNNTKFLDYKTSITIDKKINVSKTSVYQFKFNNGSLTAKTFKVRIQRIPKNESTISFNTNWQWKTVYDTNYVAYTKDSLVGYDTSYITKNKKELVKVDTLISELFTKNERVHSETAIGKTQYAYLNVNLPVNSYSPNSFNPYQSTELISWSYWVGVGQNAKDEYNKSNSSFKSGISAISSISGYGALASLALNGVSMISSPNVGDNVQYKFVSYRNGVKSIFDSGNGISATGRNTSLLQGGFTIELFNDNFRDGIDVEVKVVCVQIRKTWENKKITEQLVKPRYIKLNKTRMVINSKEIRVNVQN